MLELFLQHLTFIYNNAVDELQKNETSCADASIVLNNLGIKLKSRSDENYFWFSNPSTFEKK